MTVFEPTLILRQLRVMKDNRTVFDETFRTGVNILRGENGSGKSTIADLIFYALGGDSPPLKREALLCDSVLADVLFSGSPVTLRREVTSLQMRPMSIYFGPLADAVEAGNDQWQTYPYAARNDRESFSSVLFRSLGMPETQGVMQTRITMHQILRLMYIDQQTSYDRIFRAEDFDSAITREAVGAFLCGFDEPALYDAKIRLQEAEREYSFVSKELKTIFEVLGPAGESMSVAFLEQEEHNKAVERKELVSRIEQLAGAGSDVPEPALAAAEKDRSVLREHLAKVRAELRQAREMLEKREFDYVDSAQFMEALSRRLSTAKEAGTVHAVLGLVKFDYCPACYTHLGESESGVCHVCKAPADVKEGGKHLQRMQNELEVQLAESEKLQKQRLADLEAAREEVLRLRSLEKQLNRRLEELGQDRSPTNQAALADLNQRLGYLDRELEDVSRRLALARRIDGLSEKKGELASEITRIRDQIAALGTQEKNRRIAAKSTISEHCIALLNRDLEREEGFRNVTSVNFDFGENRVEVDGRSNFAASSMVFLKNSFHFSILAASASEPFFRYPRFGLFDNIEDKGMETARSHRFQNLVVDASRSLSVDHQIIMTTSMIAPELDTPDLTIGRYFTHENKSLDLSGKEQA